MLLGYYTQIDLNCLLTALAEAKKHLQQWEFGWCFMEKAKKGVMQFVNELTLELPYVLETDNDSTISSVPEVEKKT